MNKVTGRSWDDLSTIDEPLKVVGELIADDIAIMSKLPTPQHPDDDTSYKYAASINCFSFPGEMMTSKIGLVMGGVHEPVPGFNQKILKPVNSWFDLMQSPSHRLNWWLQPDHRYFRPEFHAFASTENNASEVAEQKEMTIEDIYYRVERQSFIRLPKTKAIVFGVRLFIYPLLDVITAVEAKEHAAGPPKGNYDDPDPDKRPLRPFVERLYSGWCSLRGLTVRNIISQSVFSLNRRRNDGTEVQRIQRTKFDQRRGTAVAREEPRNDRGQRGPERCSCIRRDVDDVGPDTLDTGWR